MNYEDFEDLARRTASNKVLRDKAFKIESNSKNDGYQRGLASMVYGLLDKKSTGSSIKKEIKQNQQQLAEELHKPVVRRF